MNEIKLMELEKENEILNETYDVITHTTSDGYIEIDTKTAKFLKVNDSFCEMHGYTREELLKMNINDIDATESPEETKKRIEHIIKNKFARFEAKHKRKNGEIIDVEVSVTFSEKQNKFFTFFRNITDFKKQAKALIESESTFKAHVENSFDIIFTLNKEGKFIFLSSAWERHFGLSVKDAIGKNFSNFVHPDDINPCFEYLKSVLITGKGERSPQFRVKHADGRFLWFEANGMTYIDTNGNIQFIGVGRDITESKKLQEQLIKSEKLSAVGQLAAGIAHEFNNLMAIISMNTQLLEYSEKSENENLRKHIDTVNSAVTRGKGIVNNLMAFAKPQVPEKKFYDICDLVDDVIKLYGKQLELDNIQIIKKCCLNRLQIYVDKYQIEQVLLNMIINARHAIQPKGKGIIEIGCEANKKNVSWFIKDSGIGISKENLKNIFTPFFTTKGRVVKNNV